MEFVDVDTLDESLEARPIAPRGQELAVQWMTLGMIFVEKGPSRAIEFFHLGNSADAPKTVMLSAHYRELFERMTHLHLQQLKAAMGRRGSCYEMEKKLQLLLLSSDTLTFEQLLKSLQR